LTNQPLFLHNFFTIPSYDGRYQETVIRLGLDEGKENQMKKITLFVIGITILGLALFSVQETLAEEPTPPEPPANTTRRGFRGQGRSRFEEGDGFLEPYMISTLTSEFGLTEEEFKALHEGGDETLWDYAQSIGLTWEEFHDKLDNARKAALEEAVLDGVFSQEQAEWMIDRMHNMRGRNDRPEQGPCKENTFKDEQFGRGMWEGRGKGHW
jgi:hypothetical protein